MADLKAINPWKWQDQFAFTQAGATLGARLHASGCIPSGTLLGVARLFHPDILVEIEATAVA